MFDRRRAPGAAGGRTLDWGAALIARLTFALVLLPLSAVAAEKLSVAAAANLVFALEPLHDEFRKLNPGIQLTVATGASGSLVAQMQHGATYDVFLSADVDYPERLIELGRAERTTLTRFAVGRLVLWTTRQDIAVDDVAAVVRHPRVRKISIAHVQTAPYGRAAREALTALGLWSEVQAKLVTGESITQTAQFVETGHADAGFVALSLVLSPRLKTTGRWHEVDARLYAPIEQAAVATTTGAKNPAATRYLAFLLSPEARRVFERFGYAGPKSAPAESKAKLDE